MHFHTIIVLFSLHNALVYQDPLLFSLSGNNMLQTIPLQTAALASVYCQRVSFALACAGFNFDRSPPS